VNRIITPTAVEHQINRIISHLVEIGLASDQNCAFTRESPDCVKVTFQNAGQVSIALKDRQYEEIYEHLAKERAYNVKMPDGGLLQMMYNFEELDGPLQSHRLAFFPSPHLEEFQNNPDVYMEDDVYADVIAKNVVPFPIRFDYDIQDGIHQELVHPKSHLTLGQYEKCRIPVTAALTPSLFVDFILRNFYNTAFSNADSLPRFKQSFEESILRAERNVVHVVIPRGA
jgi:hypothetical protein